MQHDVAQPARVLHGNGLVQAELALESFAVDLAGGEGVLFLHGVDDIAGDEPDQQKDDHAQDQERRDDQQHPSDDVRSHGRYLAVITRRAEMRGEPG